MIKQVEKRIRELVPELQEQNKQLSVIFAGNPTKYMPLEYHHCFIDELYKLEEEHD